MFKRIKLRKRESRVIRKIAELQIGVLTDLLRESDSPRILIYLINNNITRLEYLNELHIALCKFEEIKDVPRKLFYLDSVELDVAKYILKNGLKEPKYLKGKESVYTKLEITEKLNLN